MPIKPVNDIPMTLQEKRASYREMIRQDIYYALTNHISIFEFDGDYNYKYLANYAREEADMIFRRSLYLDVAKRVKEELAKKLNLKYIFTDHWRYKDKYIKIRTKKGEDRIHVFGQIDFDFADKFYEILLSDTEEKYKAIEARKKRKEGGVDGS